jgi:hypothetical protein
MDTQALDGQRVRALELMPGDFEDDREPQMLEGILMVRVLPAYTQYAIGKYVVDPATIVPAEPEAVSRAAWAEDEHPRDEHGRFSDKSEGHSIDVYGHEIRISAGPEPPTETMQKIASSLDALQTQCPSLFGHLNGVAIVDLQNSDVVSRTSAEGEIRLNARWWGKAPETLDRVLDLAVSTGWCPEKCDQVRDQVNHEFGHVIFDTAMKSPAMREVYDDAPSSICRTAFFGPLEERWSCYVEAALNPAWAPSKYQPANEQAAELDYVTRVRDWLKHPSDGASA